MTDLHMITLETLAFVNAERAKRGLPPRRRLLKGAHSGYDCPVARSLGFERVYVSRYCWWTPHWETFGNLPRAITAFIRHFDAGLLPEYQKKSR